MAKEKFSFSTQIVTPVFRVSYPSVFVAKHNDLAKREEYTVQMLFDKANKAELNPMVALMNQIIAAKWSQKPKLFTSPFEDGDLKVEKNPNAAGMIVIKSWSKNKPGVVNSKLEVILNTDEIYGGCYARAQVNAYGWEYAGKFGVNFSLLNLQKVKDGQPFGNRVKPEDAFAPVAEDESQAEPVQDGMFS